MNFVDEARLRIVAGDGGDGCCAFLREKYRPNGGPSGGDGGNGGSVYAVADENVSTLLDFRSRHIVRAPRGENGRGKNQHGANGADTWIKLPVGTVVVHEESGDVLADLTENGQVELLAAGGRGGRGNARFATPTHQAPRRADPGTPGDVFEVRLELRLLADVGLVGLPNAGKSSFLARVSAAKPKIADYPFTTLEPNLGVVRLDESTEFVVADVPGLIEGASEGRGLGHTFLRHVERARVLCVMVDLSDPTGPTPAEQERVLLRELGQYRPELLERPRLVVGTKSDSAVHDWDGLRLSAVTNQGVRELVGRLASLVHEARQAEPDHEGVVILRPEAAGARVERMTDGEFRLVGRQVERVVALNDVTTPEALSYIDHQLRRLGVPKLLARAGARDGDVVWIAGFSFEYHEDR